MVCMRAEVDVLPGHWCSQAATGAVHSLIVSESYTECYSIYFSGYNCPHCSVRDVCNCRSNSATSSITVLLLGVKIFYLFTCNLLCTSVPVVPIHLPHRTPKQVNPSIEGKSTGSG